MTQPRLRHSTPTTREPVFTVDYNDVLTQAVANERDNVAREILKLIEDVPTSTKTQVSRYYSDSKDRTAYQFKQDLLKNIAKWRDA